MLGSKFSKLLRSRIILACSGAVLLVVVVPVILIFTGRSQSAGLDYNLAALTGQLLNTSQKLQTSFSSQGGSGQLTKSYLGYMKQLQADCHKVNAYRVNGQRAISAGAAARLSNSQALCKDLAQLAYDSQTIYTAVLPLMTASAQLKFYQTIWPSRLKNQQSGDVSSAIKQLRGPVGQLNFPTQSLTWLKQLQTTIDQSKGLTYYPSVINFQSQMLAERAQYWFDYGDLASLVQTLKLELQGYCQNISGNQPGTCHQG